MQHLQLITTSSFKLTKQKKTTAFLKVLAGKMLQHCMFDLEKGKNIADPVAGENKTTIVRALYGEVC